MNKSKLMQSGFTMLKALVLMAISLAVATIFCILSGYDSLGIFKGLVRAFSKDIAGTIRWATPMILCGLAVCVPFSGGAFNLGIDGQIYFGALGGTIVGLLLPASSGAFGIFTMFIVSMIFGAAFAIIPAVLKIYMHADIVVTTLLLNFVAQLLNEALLSNVMRDPGLAVQMNASPIFAEELWLPRLASLGVTSANIGIYFALGAVILITFIFKKTKLGYEIKLVGTNPKFALYGGIKPNAITIKVMAISGAIAGMVGAIEITAIQHRLIAGFNPGLGFDGIVVSLLAGNNPLGVLLSGIFFGALKNSGINMERITNVPQMVTQIIMAIIVLSISAEIVLPKIRRKKEVKS